MLDIQFIRDHAKEVKQAVTDKGLTKTIDIDALLVLDTKRRLLLRETELLRAKRNEVSDIVAREKDPEKKKRLITDASKVKGELQGKEETFKEVTRQYDEMMIWVPQIPAADVPKWKSEADNVVLRKEGTPKQFDFPVQDHISLGENLDLLDIERGAKLAGFRGYFLKNEGLMLSQAILDYALRFMMKQGFTPMHVPWMVKPEYFEGTGYFPWGAEDHFTVQDNLHLIGTAEVSLTAYYANETLKLSDLPMKLTGISPCFRREVGSYGKDVRGVIRVHEFMKVEQVVLLPADEELTRTWHDKMLGFSEQILKDLELPYQVLLMCTADMGAGQRKKYDIETWFPAQQKYRETHSDSYFLDFQSRRLNLRYKDTDGTLKYVYTINNTVAATPRLLAAVLENYQQQDGSVVVPNILREFVGKDTIHPKG